MPVRSPYPDVDIPAVSLPEFLFGNDLGGYATLPAFVDGVTGYSVTFAELHEQVLRIAAALAERGSGTGTSSPSSPPTPRPGRRCSTACCVRTPC